MSEPSAQAKGQKLKRGKLMRARSLHGKGARGSVAQSAAAAIALRTRSARMAMARAEGMPILPPWIAIFELLAFIAVVLGLTVVYPGFDLNAVRPNPCWLPVLLLSLQYGTVSGLLSALCGIGLTLYFGLPDQEIGENYYAYLVRAFAEPMLWLGTAILVGQFRQRQIAEKRDLRRLVGELTQQRAALAEFSQNLRDRCDKLEREIVGRPAIPILRTLAVVASLRGGRAQALDATLAELVAELPAGTQASVYGAKSGSLACLAATAAPNLRHPRPELILPQSDVYAVVMGEAKAVTVLRRADEPIIGRFGLAALPIHAPLAHDPVGLLLIEAMPTDGLEAEGMNGLSIIADALGPALVQHLAQSASAKPALVALGAAARTASSNGEASRDETVWANVRKRFSLTGKPAPPRTTS